MNCTCEAGEVGDVVHHERAVGQIERPGRQAELVQIDELIPNTWLVRCCLRSLEHAGGHVEREHVGGTSLDHPAGERTETTSEVDDVRPDQLRKEEPDRRPLGGAVKAVHRTPELLVGSKEIPVVVDVLGHLDGR